MDHIVEEKIISPGLSRTFFIEGKPWLNNLVFKPFIVFLVFEVPGLSITFRVSILQWDFGRFQLGDTIFGFGCFHYIFLNFKLFTGQTTKRNNKFVSFCGLTCKLYNLLYSVSYLPRYYLEMIDWQSTLQSRQLFNSVPWGEFMHYWEMRSVNQVKK